LARFKTTETFITDATYKHAGKYSYLNTIYQASNIKVTIICSNHGEFLQTPNDHLKGSGCKNVG